MNESKHSVFGTATPYEGLNDQGSEILTDDVRGVLEEALVFVMLPLFLLGVITNTINIRVFIEQGVRNDSTNIGFISLSLFDLLSCVTMIPYCLCYVVKYTDDLTDHFTCIAFATQFAYVHVILQHSSAWTTVYISLIRSLCVVIPLKVKLLFTPKITTTVVISIFLFFLLTELLYSAFTEMTWVLHPYLNKSFVFVSEKIFAQNYLYYYSIFANHILAVVAIIIVSVTTRLMVKKLYEVKKWREKNASGSSHKSNIDGKASSEKKLLATKDIELVKSVTVVTFIFLVCVLMGYIPATAIVAFPGVNFSGINRNLYVVLYLVRFFFDAINSSINFFFYIRISSRYKTAFASAFQKCLRQDVD